MVYHAGDRFSEVFTGESDTRSIFRAIQFDFAMKMYGTRIAVSNPKRPKNKDSSDGNGIENMISYGEEKENMICIATMAIRTTPRNSHSNFNSTSAKSL